MRECPPPNRNVIFAKSMEVMLALMKNGYMMTPDHLQRIYERSYIAIEDSVIDESEKGEKQKRALCKAR